MKFTVDLKPESAVNFIREVETHMPDKIERNIPIPRPTGQGRQSKWPFLKTMAVGESVLIADPDRADRQLDVRMSALGKATGKRFTRRRVDGGVRIWRIK